VKPLGAFSLCTAILVLTQVPALRGDILTYLLPSPEVLVAIGLSLVGVVWRFVGWDRRSLLRGAVAVGCVVGIVLLMFVAISGDMEVPKEISVWDRLLGVAINPIAWLLFVAGVGVPVALVLAGYALVAVLVRGRARLLH